MRKTDENPSSITSIRFTPASSSVCHTHQHFQSIRNLQYHTTTHIKSIPKISHITCTCVLAIYTTPTVLRLPSPDNSATKPTPHESLSNDGSYRPRGFSGTAESKERTTTRSLGERPGPSDRHKWSFSDPAGRNRVPKNLLAKALVDFLVAEHAAALLPSLAIGVALS